MDILRRKAIEFQKKQAYATSDHMSKEACYKGFLEGVEALRELIIIELAKRPVIVDLEKFIKNIG